MMSINAQRLADGLENSGSLAGEGKVKGSELRHSFQSLHIHRFKIYSPLQLGMNI